MAENQGKPDALSTAKPSPEDKLSGIENMKTDAKKILREALTATLATTHHEQNTPYASLVTVATDTDNSPILLLSGLAVHTKNIRKTPKACLLLQRANNEIDPLEDSRLSVWGTIEETTSPRANTRFLARHPAAKVYADFDDFSFFKLNVENAHYVGGFGRIRTLTAEDLATDCSGCDELLDLESGFVRHMNNDHAQAVSAIAAKYLDAPEGDWVLAGLDPEGMDFIYGRMTRRFNFDTSLKTPEEMKAYIEDLANQAKGHRHDH